MKKVLWLVAIAILLTAGSATASVVGTKHDLSSALTGSTQVCVFCHTPHNAGVNGSATNERPLWNHTLSTTAAYGAYDSITMDGDMSTADFAGSANIASALCMSCHDGTVGLGSLYNKPNADSGTGEVTPTNATVTISGSPNLGTDLSNDHPVNFTYPTTDTEIVTPVSDVVGGVAPLFAGKLQCASCHDVHDDTNNPFLVTNNTNSNLCTTCHTK